MFNELIQQIVSILRYIASPAVGLLVALLVGDSRKIVQAIAQASCSGNAPLSPWLLAGFLAVTGVTVYYAHQTLFHQLILRCLVRHHTRTLNLTTTMEELAFARWERRGAAVHTAEQSVQSALDETNAAGHFFYCSAWSSLLFALILRNEFPNEYQPSPELWVVFGVIVIALFLVAVICDNRTTKLDIEAFLRYKKTLGA